MAILNFNSADHADEASFDAIPTGWYTVKIVASEMKDTKSGTGQYLSMELDVVDGQYKGRKVWDRLNLVNKNQVAVDIAQRTLSTICRAVGIPQIKDSEQLHNRPLQAKVTYVEDDYGIKNEVKSYKAVANVAALGALPTPAAAREQVAAKAGATKPPWSR